MGTAVGGAKAMGNSTKEAILDAVLAEVMDQGLGNLTLKAVAGRAGITTGLLSYHYKSRAALMAAVADRWRSKMATAEKHCWEAFAEGDGPADGTRRAVEEASDFVRANPGEIRMLLRHIVIEGELPPEVAKLSLPLATSTSGRAAGFIGVSPARARAVFHQAAVLLTRFAIITDDELLALYAEPDDEDPLATAWARCRRHAAHTIVGALGLEPQPTDPAALD